MVHGRWVVVAIAVEDSGQGVALEKQASLFVPYVQVRKLLYFCILGDVSLA
jgi:signal transduction histidine kinase